MSSENRSAKGYAKTMCHIGRAAQPKMHSFLQFRVHLQRFFFAAYFFQFMFFSGTGFLSKRKQKETGIWGPQDVPKNVTKNVSKNVVWGLVLRGHKCRD